MDGRGMECELVVVEPTCRMPDFSDRTGKQWAMLYRLLKDMVEHNEYFIDGAMQKSILPTLLRSQTDNSPYCTNLLLLIWGRCF